MNLYRLRKTIKYIVCLPGVPAGFRIEHLTDMSLEQGRSIFFGVGPLPLLAFKRITGYVMHQEV
jgi:hypothetical protein